MPADRAGFLQISVLFQTYHGIWYKLERVLLLILLKNVLKN